MGIVITMNRILFSLLAISTILFSGCSLSEPSPQDVDRASSENIQKIRQGKTFLVFKTPLFRFLRTIQPKW